MRCAGVRGYIIGLHKDIYGCAVFGNNSRLDGLAEFRDRDRGLGSSMD